MKRFLALMMVFAFVVSAGAVAFADDAYDVYEGDGTITTNATARPGGF